MSKRLKTTLNYFIITDTVTGEEDIRDSKENITYKDDNGNISFYAKSTGLKKSIINYTVANTVNGDDSDNPFADLAALKLYLDTNTGFNDAGSSAIPTSEIFNGGFVDYNDSGASQPVTVVGSPVILQNDGAGAFTNKTYLPADITDLWDVILDKFDWSELKLGDMVDIRLDIQVVTTSPNTTIDVNLHLGTGGGAYIIPFITKTIIKSAGTLPLNYFNGIYMGDTNTLDNGGQFKISTDTDCSVIVNGWYIKIIRKG